MIKICHQHSIISHKRLLRKVMKVKIPILHLIYINIIMKAKLEICLFHLTFEGDKNTQEGGLNCVC